MNIKTLGILAGCVLLATACGRQKDKVVACVGDSITEGFAINWQSRYAYPERLDSILGEGYEVVNLGRSSTTMMLNGDFPYWTAKEFTDVFRVHPDVIVIKLGTNDAKLKQWNPEAYRESYQRTIDTFLTISPKPEIILCTPVHAIQTRWEITDSVVGTYVRPIVQELAQKNNLKLIDLYNAIGTTTDLYVRDGIHPNGEGAKAIAAEVAKFIK